MQQLREPVIAKKNRAIARKCYRALRHLFDHDAIGMVSPPQGKDRVPLRRGDLQRVDFGGPDGLRRLLGVGEAGPA